MKLMAPRIVAELTNTAKDRSMSDAARESAAELARKINRAEKFVFDSGMSGNDGEEQVFRETAVNMMEAGLFHLPYPEMWIEDPFEILGGGEGGQQESRYMYLCEEVDGEIRIWFAADPFGDIVILPAPLVIDLKNPTDTFGYPAENPQNPPCYKVAGEAVYAVKKFLVTLSTRGTERVPVKGGNWSDRMTPRGRKYPHTVVRIPTDYSAPVAGRSGEGGYRRMHLVRGYTWGKNTRPLDEQRWIQPFFRGREELGEVERSHYVVKAQPA
jgi:hypothetical protein